MYVQDGGFQPPKVEGLLPHFLVLHQMRRRTLAPRIGYSEAIPAYERNLLDALMKLVRFDIFEYIVDEIWNIATNPLRSCVFAPYIQFMIESVVQEKFYKGLSCWFFCCSFSHYPQWWCPLCSCYQLWHLEDALGYLCHMPTH
jgi:hypothetical protein